MIPAGEGLPLPERSYLVCATPRSGSTLLCQALKATGLAGRPEEYFEARRATGAPRSAREYFHDVPGFVEAVLGSAAPPPAPDYSSLAAVPDYREHLRSVLRRGTGSNGVFGAKLMWMHVEDFVPLARSLPELNGTGLTNVLAELFPGLDYVWVRRRDDVRQAVSLWRAVQTQAWRADDGGAGDHPPEYNFIAIDHLLKNLRSDNRSWHDYFRTASVVPLEILYEDMADDLQAAVDGVLRRIGVDPGETPPAREHLKRQADQLSEAWVERYRADAAKPVAQTG